MKKRIALICAALLLLTLTSCGSGTDPDTAAENRTTPETQSESVKEESETEDAISDSDDESSQTAAAQASIRDFLQIHGRHDDGNDLKLYWTSDGFTFRFRGNGVSASIEVPETIPYYLKNYINVYIDGDIVPVDSLLIGESGKYILAAGLENTDHVLTVRKRNEAMIGSYIKFKSIEISDGEFYTEPPEISSKTIEFIGDSITCGYGNLVTDGGFGFTTAEEDGGMSFAHVTASALGAEYSVIARSGIGYMSRDGISGDTVYTCYDKVAALPGGEPLSSQNWDFSEHSADVIVINLGTNDNGFTVNGNRVTRDMYTEDGIEFLRLIREKNPDSVIIWAYGMMGKSNMGAFKSAVDTLNNEGDNKVYFLPLEPANAQKEGIGRSGHPCGYTDIDRGEILAKKIASITGWEEDESVYDVFREYFVNHCIGSES